MTVQLFMLKIPVRAYRSIKVHCTAFQMQDCNFLGAVCV